ncbi:hypothetical protein FCF10_00725 [Lactobacillus amylovorus subsp. animalium]|uniref:hypothetical protein n=1 Tax=Lactobacillus amylovorus TaxID=1604 RepID=UPI0010AC41AC|nr:hypothetical protein [Lactobacillus amylovorus]TJY06198.1 hypothetical protein FCF10_00725 [Lactobacillus amylovorus]
MNEYNFLKSIGDGKRHKPKNPDLYDQDNEEAQLILKLEKQGLIKFHIDLLDNGDYSLLDYWITDKGKQYVKENSTKDKTNSCLIEIVVGIIAAVLGALITHYLGLN